MRKPAIDWLIQIARCYQPTAVLVEALKAQQELIEAQQEQIGRL